jgi:hypothetical protein
MSPGDHRLVDMDIIGRITANADRLCLDSDFFGPLQRLYQKANLGRLGVCEHGWFSVGKTLGGESHPFRLSSYGLVQRQLKIADQDPVAGVDRVLDVGNYIHAVDDTSVGTPQID